jgi:uncharacterized repeat protein (TIGR02543 family)
VNDSTIVGNTVLVGLGGGIYVYALPGQTAFFNLYNTILYGNGLSEECYWDPTSGFVVPSGFHNLIGNSLICPGIVSNADPQLKPLQYNQGPTPTMAIPTTSPAFGAAAPVNAADPTASLPNDQRGQTRPAQMAGKTAPDIGAFELCLIYVNIGGFVVPRQCTISGGTTATAQLTIGVMPAGGGTTTPAPGASTYPFDSVVALTATANPGYAFAGWTGAVASPTSPSTAIVMNSDQAVTANFTPAACVNNLSGRGTPGILGRPDRIDLTWTAFGSAASYNVLRGTSPGGENPVPIGTTTTTAYTDAVGLVKGVTYYYVVQPLSNGAVCTSSEAAVQAP